MTHIEKTTVRTKNVFRLLRGGKSFFSHHFTIRTAHAKGQRKLAVSVPVRIAAKAVVRNRIRRRIVGIIGPLISQMAPGYLGVITPRTSEIPPHKELHDELMMLLQKSDILSK